MDILILVLIVVAIFGAWYWCNRHKRSSFEAIPGDHRPYAGDFLPVEGQVPTEGGYELLADEGEPPQTVSSLDSKLCEECVSHCVGEKVRLGLSTTFHNDRQQCFKFCEIECNPETGF
jgi:hypothetical protein